MRVVSDAAGRMRVHVPWVRSNSRRAVAVEEAVDKQNGVRAVHAYPHTGSVVVSEEVSDLATLAKVQELQKSNPEISATMQRIGLLRHIDSDSLFEELTP